MDLIIGGAYQGKLEYAKEKYSLSDSEIFECSENSTIDLSKRCIYHFERYIKSSSKKANEKLPEFRSDAIIIMDDIFCGVVPIDKEIRAWREAAGRMGTAITMQAKHVTRIFCGLAQELK